MKPIMFFRTATLALAAEDIAGTILDLANWPDSNGYGIIPGSPVERLLPHRTDVTGSPECFSLRTSCYDGPGATAHAGDWGWNLH
jgi:hypothetical protein